MPGTVSHIYVFLVYDYHSVESMCKGGMKLLHLCSFHDPAVQIAGIHPENLRVLKTDASTNYSLSPVLLEEAVSRDVSVGLVPFFLCATVRKKALPVA